MCRNVLIGRSYIEIMIWKYQKYMRIEFHIENIALLLKVRVFHFVSAKLSTSTSCHFFYHKCHSPNSSTTHVQTLITSPPPPPRSLASCPASFDATAKSPNPIVVPLLVLLPGSLKFSRTKEVHYRRGARVQDPGRLGLMRGL